MANIQWWPDPATPVNINRVNGAFTPFAVPGKTTDHVSYITESQQLPTGVTVTPLTDQYSDHRGILVISCSNVAAQSGVQMTARCQTTDGDEGNLSATYTLNFV